MNGFEGFSLPDLQRARARECGDRAAILFGERVTDFASFDRLSDRAAGYLCRRGIAAGDRVALLCVNSDVFAVAYFGILKAGATVVPVNLLLNPREVEYILRDAGARALVYHEAFADTVTAARQGAEDLSFCVGIGQTKSDPADADWQEAMGGGDEPPDLDVDPAEDVAAILYTSGTTGHPKGAMLTHRNLASNSFSIGQALHLEPGRDVMLVVLPMFHAFAATVGMLFPLLHGCAFVPLPRFDPDQVARAVEQTGATVFLGVPSMYNVLLRLPEEAVARFRSLRLAVSGGAAMPVEIMNRFEAKFGLPIHEGDGPTECSPVTSVNPIGGLRKPGTIGRPVPLVEMKILDEAGEDVARGEVGEICVRGPNVMKGYWNHPEETAQAFFGEWFRTGDLGTEDEDGYFAIVDRKKDMIIVNGMNVYPRVIEEILYRFEPVREAAVVGEPHRLHGETVVAFVSLEEGAAADANAVRAHCREHLGRHEVPRKVVFVDELPKNAAGKILKRELRRSGEVERGVDLA